ncbi:S-adenosyl-L-methionine-dependent methyltransferase [Gloeophyllum trabeum ATCC 11539]|uniref:S-adenosyl-L-methionine-dependent methyltransferase n=1 Tax=Gloeophyllum trabeum (strain ATCC 11539 / FP-39264 / Madison 617) TaxID=670483 RepID=S7QLJ7_GLOTA|nr:S-adenosyl-L-methionine-dependent methyltransferase [Gloeophyllum trabeum ATCC 11539]EPQ60258.1 S-adenosyl-L-methionine-dependent methyltransferase [Gloeophyllum trabeum ATCC 11539]
MSQNTFADPSFSAENYRAHRPKYPEHLYRDILQFHDSQGGQRRHAVDLGCGPGIVSEALTSYFDKVTGVDPSQGMVEVASKSIPEGLKVKLEYKVGSAEDIPAEHGSVDLITAGTAAHWFAPDWWSSAEKVLRSGGTVALFSAGRPFIAPSAHPEAQRLNAIMRDVVMSVLKNYFQKGNEIAFDMSRELALPPSDTGVWGPVERKVWNNDEAAGQEEIYMSEKLTIHQMKARARTGSPVHRWEAANPEKVGTAEDPIEKAAAAVKEITGWSDEHAFEMGYRLSLIMVKRL